MKIRDIYLNKKVPVVSITIALLCIIITMISQLIPSTYIAMKLMYPVQYPWQLITYIFLQGAPQEMIPEGAQFTAMQLTIGHLGYNFLLILPFGFLVEKVIGSKKFLALFVASWIVDVIATLIMGYFYTRNGDLFGVSGASGLAFTFMPVGLYILFVMGKRYGFGKLFKQISFYVLMSIAVPTIVISLTPNIAGGLSGVPSMVIHLLALVIGVVFAVIFRKTISDYFVTNTSAQIKTSKTVQTC